MLGSEGSGGISTAEVPDRHGNNTRIIASDHKETGSRSELDERDRQEFPGPRSWVLGLEIDRLYIVIEFLAPRRLVEGHGLDDLTHRISHFRDQYQQGSSSLTCGWYVASEKRRADTKCN